MRKRRSTKRLATSVIAIATMPMAVYVARLVLINFAIPRLSFVAV
jgi:hypothetical protein